MKSIFAIAAFLWAATPALADGIVLSGSIQHPGPITMAQLRAMPQVEVKVDQKTEKGNFTGDFRGVLLWTLVNKAGLVNGPQRHAVLLHGIVVSASADHYGALISLGEIHPELGNGQVILATEKDGQPLAQPILVVPGDAKAARDVRGVTSVDVRSDGGGAMHGGHRTSDHLK